MKKHKTIRASLLRWMFGIRGPLDERAEHEIGRVCTNAFKFLFLYFMVVLAVSLVLTSVLDPAQSAYLIIALVTWGWIISAVVVSIGISHSGVMVREVSSARYTVERRKLVFDGVIRALVAAFLYDVLCSLPSVKSGASGFLRSLVSIEHLGQAILFALIFMCFSIASAKATLRDSGENDE